MTLFLTRTHKSIFLCDVTTESRTLYNGSSESIIGFEDSFCRVKSTRDLLKANFCCLKKAKINVLLMSAERYKKSFKNLYVKTSNKTKQGCVALLAIILKHLKGLLHKVQGLSRVKFALRTSPEKTPAEKEGNNFNAHMSKLTMEDYNKLKSLVDTILNTAPEICNQSAINLAWKIYLGK